MNISDNGALFIKDWEKCSLKAYWDQDGYPTNGWGHLLSEIVHDDLAKYPDITQQEADHNFLVDIAPTSAAVNAAMQGCALIQGHFDALVSLTYNIGVRAFTGSTVRRLVHAGAPADEIRAAFLMWDKVRDPATGQLVVSQGLLNRRNAEADLYAKAA